MKKGQISFALIGAVLSLFVFSTNSSALWLDGDCNFVVMTFSRDYTGIAGFSDSYFVHDNGNLYGDGDYQTADPHGAFTAQPYQIIGGVVSQYGDSTFLYYYSGATGDSPPVTNADFTQMSTDPLPTECPVVPPAYCNEEDIAEAEATCGAGNVEYTEWTQSIEFAQCQWNCEDDCQTEYENLYSFCGGGIASFNYDFCIGECIDCYDLADDAQEICSVLGGVYTFDCDIGNSFYDNLRYINYTLACNEDPDTVPDETLPGEDNGEDPTEDGTDIADEDDDPSEDPIVADDGANGWLMAIKENTDTIIEQNNDRADQLSDVVSNTNVIADNQSVIQDEIRHVANSVNDASDAIVDAINDNGDQEGFDDSGIIAAIEEVNATLEEGYEIDEYTGDLGTDLPLNAYDSSVSAVTEDSFSDAINNFITDGLPFMNFISGSYLDITDQQASMEVELWNGSVFLDFSPVEDIIDWMGLILLSICSMYSFFIIVKR